jgi:hypothetical protein
MRILLIKIENAFSKWHFGYEFGIHFRLMAHNKVNEKIKHHKIIKIKIHLVFPHPHRNTQKIYHILQHPQQHAASSATDHTESKQKEKHEYNCVQANLGTANSKEQIPEDFCNR